MYIFSFGLGLEYGFTEKETSVGFVFTALLERLVSDLRIQLSSCILGRLRIGLSQLMCDIELFGLNRSV